MYELKITSEISSDIASKIKNLRIANNNTQEEFALKVGVTLSTYRTFERNGKGSFETFIKIVSGLGRLGELKRMLLLSDFSPIEALKQKKKPQRQRVKKEHKTNIAKQISIKKEENFLDMIKKKNGNTK